MNDGYEKHFQTVFYRRVSKLKKKQKFVVKFDSFNCSKSKTSCYKYLKNKPHSERPVLLPECRNFSVPTFPEHSRSLVLKLLNHLFCRWSWYRYGDRLSHTGLKWRRTKEPLLFRLGLVKQGIVTFALFFCFMDINYFGSGIWKTSPILQCWFELIRCRWFDLLLLLD